MQNNHKVLLENEKTAEKEAGKPRQPYHKPRLEELGDLRDLTLGGSPGVGDSGSPMTQSLFFGYGAPAPFETPGEPLLPPKN